MLWKCCTQYASKFGKLSSGHKTGKGQFSFQSPRKVMPKNFPHNCTHLTCQQSNAQNSPTRLQQYANCELPDVQAEFRKGRERNQRSNCQHLLDHQKSKRVPEKTSTSALLTMPKPLTVWITINCGKFWKRWEYQTTWPASWEICMQVRKQQIELDMELQTGSK